VPLNPRCVVVLPNSSIIEERKGKKAFACRYQVHGRAIGNKLRLLNKGGPSWVVFFSVERRG
jgi:hypothetical protein